MPPFHSTAARGTFPTEQTNDTIATIGPIRGPTIFDPTGSAERKKACQNSFGTQAARAPARSWLISLFVTTAWTMPDRAKPRISGHRISQPIAKAIQSAETSA